MRWVDLPAAGQAEEAALGDPLGPLGDGGVGGGPVHRQPEHPPQVLEDLLVLGGELVAERDEVGTGDGDRVASGGSAGGTKSGSKGRLGSHRTPK